MGSTRTAESPPPQTPRPAPVRLIAFLKPYWKLALLAPLLMVLEVAMDLAQPRYLERIVDLGIAKQQMDVVLHTGLLMVLMALGGLLAMSDRRYRLKVSAGGTAPALEGSPS